MVGDGYDGNQEQTKDNKNKREFRGLGFHNNDYGHK